MLNASSEGVSFDLNAGGLALGQFPARVRRGAPRQFMPGSQAESGALDVSAYARVRVDDGCLPPHTHKHPGANPS